MCGSGGGACKSLTYFRKETKTEREMNLVTSLSRGSPKLLNTAVKIILSVTDGLESTQRYRMTTSANLGDTNTLWESLSPLPRTKEKELFVWDWWIPLIGLVESLLKLLRTLHVQLRPYIHRLNHTQAREFRGISIVTWFLINLQTESKVDSRLGFTKVH